MECIVYYRNIFYYKSVYLSVKSNVYILNRELRIITGNTGSNLLTVIGVILGSVV